MTLDSASDVPREDVRLVIRLNPAESRL